MSSKRGRPTTFPTADVRRLLEERKEEVIQDGNIVGKKSKIWNDICDIINVNVDAAHHISTAHLYVAVKLNRYQLQDFLFECFRYQLQNCLFEPISGSVSSGDTEEAISLSQSSTSDTCVASSESSLSDEPTGSLNFNIKISRQEWNEMRPEAVTYPDKRGFGKKRTYLRLRRRTWTHIINNHFWKCTKLPCRLSYHGGRLTTAEATHAITINGACTFCKSKLYGYVEKLPEEGKGVEFICSYKGCFSTEHPKNKKRNLAGVARKRAVHKMLKDNIAPLGFQRKEADELMEKGDLEPSHLPSTNQLRDAKYKETKNLRIDDNPIISIAKAMHESRFKNIIRDVHYDKFLVRYHSSTQIHVYKQFCKDNKPISVAIDATGGVVKKIKRAPGVKSGHIFLYNLVVRDKNAKKIYPICSLLSERQDTETIRHWLATFLRCGVPSPDEVVTDMSLALMSACVQAFTSLPSLESYIDSCAKLMKLKPDKGNSNIPECFVRNDVAHLVKMITSWKCFQRCHRITKQFFVRCLCQVLQSRNLEQVKSLLTHIVMVSTSETEGKNVSGEDTPCEISKRTLISQIGGLVQESDDITSLIDTKEEKQPKIKKKKRKYIDNDFSTMFTNIVDEVGKKIVPGNRGNQQYLPDLIKHIAEIAPLIPTWTSIMVPVFGFGGKTASSAPVETDFKLLKRVIFQHETLPMRADDFVFQHIPSIEGAMKIAAASNFSVPYEVFSGDSSSDGKEVDKMDISGDVDDSDVRHRTLESKQREDWRGLISSQNEKRRKHSSYLQNDPALMLCDFSRARPTNSIGLLKNGNSEQLQPVMIQGDKFILSNTCAFDSMVQLFAVAYCDSHIFKNEVDATTNKFFTLVKQMVVNGVNRETYASRTKLLAPLYRNVDLLPGGIKKIRCEISIGALVPMVLVGNPAISEETTCSNGSCPQPIRRNERVLISVPIHSPDDLPHLNALVNVELKERRTKCFKITDDGSYCTGQKTLQRRVRQYVLLEPIDIANEEKLLQCVSKVKDIPQKISVDGKEMYLRGCVAFIGSDNVKEVGHYVAYTLRNNGLWETYDDLKSKKESGAPKDDVKCHLILYTL